MGAPLRSNRGIWAGGRPGLLCPGTPEGFERLPACPTPLSPPWSTEDARRAGRTVPLSEKVHSHSGRRSRKSEARPERPGSLGRGHGEGDGSSVHVTGGGLGARLHRAWCFSSEGVQPLARRRSPAVKTAHSRISPLRCETRLETAEIRRAWAIGAPSTHRAGSAPPTRCPSFRVWSLSRMQSQ